MTGKMNTKERALATTILLEITQEWRCSITLDEDEVTITAPFNETHAHHSGETLLDALKRALDTAKYYAKRFPSVEGEETETVCMSAGTSTNEGSKDR